MTARLVTWIRIQWPRIALIVAIGFMLSPLIYMVGVSFHSQSEIYSHPLNPIPNKPTFEGYQQALAKLNYFRLMFVSLSFAIGVTLIQLVIAFPSAYVFTFINFPGRDLVFGLFLGTLTIPFVVTYVPNYLFMAQLKLINTLPGLILPLSANAYGIFLLRQNFRSFPKSVIEAARVDGLSHWLILWKVLLPTQFPVLSALGIYLFVTTWNHYIWPSLVAQSADMQTLTVGVQNFSSGEGGSNFPAMMAAATLACLPTLIIFLVLRRPILKTFMEGAVK